MSEQKFDVEFYKIFQSSEPDFMLRNALDEAGIPYRTATIVEYGESASQFNYSVFYTSEEYVGQAHLVYSKLGFNDEEPKSYKKFVWIGFWVMAALTLFIIAMEYFYSK